MTKIFEDSASDSANDSNPIVPMGLIKFWFNINLLYLKFPISLGICFVVLGLLRSWQLIRALVHDFTQIILPLLLVVVRLSWCVWHFKG